MRIFANCLLVIEVATSWRKPLAVVVAARLVAEPVA
jgi:hypothetical protein